VLVQGREVTVSGRLPRIVRLAYEYDWLENPQDFVEQLLRTGSKGDVFSFLDRPTLKAPGWNYRHSMESISVIPLTSYEVWWKNQINDKTRNMIRKSQKMGVEVRLTAFTDELVWGIKEIYDESPVRQGKPFRHYRKDFLTIKKDHITFVERSQFIGAYYENQLIGFIKLVHDQGLSHLMQIISKKRYQRMAPTNALLAKAVELCADRGVEYLHYGLWSKRGLGDFKRHNAFERLNLPRYYVPLSLHGKLLLKMNFHRNVSEQMPEWLIEWLLNMRAKLYMLRYGAERI
jgi:hypothetical protein